MRGAGRLAAASRAMEGNMHLLQLIRKMRSQIDELERENRALRGELRACGPSATAARAGSLASPMAQPDPTPGPAAAASEQAGTVTPLRAARAGPLLWFLLICGRGGRASCCMAAFTACSGLPQCPRPHPLARFLTPRSHRVPALGLAQCLAAPRARRSPQGAPRVFAEAELDSLPRVFVGTDCPDAGSGPLSVSSDLKDQQLSLCGDLA